jgi:nitronate monooxygenase
MAWPDKRLIDLFGIELRIIQAPMANACGVDMAVAVAEAGGLGSFPCAALTDDKIGAGVAEIRSRTKPRCPGYRTATRPRAGANAARVFRPA